MSQSSGLDPGARSFPCREPCSEAPGALVPENAERWPHAPRLLVHFSLSVLSRPPSALPVLSAAAPNRSLRDSRAQASSWHTRPWLLRSTCDRPRLGSKPMFSAAAGGFFTTEPPGRPASSNIKSECVSFQCMTKSTTKKKKKKVRGEKRAGATVKSASVCWRECQVLGWRMSSKSDGAERRLRGLLTWALRDEWECLWERAGPEWPRRGHSCLKAWPERREGD